MQQQLLSVPDHTGFDLKFSLFGIPTRVHPLFWLMALVITYTEGRLAAIPIGIACVFISILVHEFGHALANVYYGYKDCSVALYMMGGLCIPGPSGSPSRFPRIAMIFWGPLAGFILAGIVYAAAFAIQRGLLPSPHFYVLYAMDVLLWINLVWGVMNLLPVLPLDGGQIVWEILRMKRPVGADVLAFTISMVSAGLVAGGFLVYGFIQKNVGGVLFPVMMFAFLAVQNFQVRKALQEYGGNFGGEVERREAWEQDPDWWKK